MRRYLVALTILCLVLMSQSVLAVVPAPTPDARAEGLVEAWGAIEWAESTRSEAIPIPTAPEPAAVSLLMFGLLGLFLVGNRAPGDETSRNR